MLDYVENYSSRLNHGDEKQCLSHHMREGGGGRCFAVYSEHAGLSSGLTVFRQGTRKANSRAGPLLGNSDNLVKPQTLHRIIPHTYPNKCIISLYNIYV
jgi:hypothetical protein